MPAPGSLGAGSHPEGEAVPRILVTGWRDWPSNVSRAVSVELTCIVNVFWKNGTHWSAITIAQGECPYGGVDRYAKEWAIRHGIAVESHPARTGPNGRILGPERNSHMVSLGADICLVMPGPGSRGTWDCARKASEAGIPLVIKSWEEVRRARN